MELRTKLAAILFLTFAAITVVPAHAAEGFEGGVLPPGWTVSVGGVFITSTAVTNLAPTAGVRFGFIAADQGSAGTPMAFTGVPGATTGTWLLSPPFSVAPGQEISMRLNFLTTDGDGFPDFAFVKLLAAGTPVTGPYLATLYTANTTGPVSQAVPALGGPGGVSPGVILTPATAFFGAVATGPIRGITYGPSKFGGGNGGSTGWVTSQFTPAAGTYQLLFLVSNVADTGVPSSLAVDDIQAALGGCPPHTVHGHISTVPPTHSGTSHEHHGVHGHTVAANCPPHSPNLHPSSPPSGGSHQSENPPPDPGPRALGLTADASEGLIAPNSSGIPVDFVGALDQDGTVNGELAPGRDRRPAPRGSIVQLFGLATHLFLAEEDDFPAGRFMPPATGSPLFYTTSLPEVRIGGVVAKVLFSGLAPGLRGVWQINLLVPEQAPAGSVPVTVSYEGEEFTSVSIVVE